jgi:hypothetical protein
MAKLIYSMLTSLDGYTEDEDGRGEPSHSTSGRNDGKH